MRIIYTLFFVCFSLICQAQSTQELIDIGHRNYELGEYQEAIDFLDKAADKDQKNPEIFYLLGVCKSQLQKNAEAIKDYDLALALDPSYAEVYFEKGYSLFALNMLDEAIEAFDKSIKLKPNNALAYVNRGSVKCIKGDKEGAMKDWKKAEELGAPLPDQECDV